MSPGPDSLPLPALLSAAVCAFTVEADNATELRLPHKTNRSGDPKAPWLPSLAMYFNCVRTLAEEGEMTAGELERRVRMGTNLDGMRRWGYITLDGVGRIPRRSGGGGRPKPRPASRLALTERGREADAVWRTLVGEIEARWRERFGAEEIDRLRAALIALLRQYDAAMPDFMPIVSVHQRNPQPPPREAGDAEHDDRLSLIVLLCRVLTGFERDAEEGARMPLMLFWNQLRVLDAGGPVPVRELPERTGISKEAHAMITGRLAKAGVLVEEARPAPARGKQLNLTAERGAAARAEIQRRIADTTEDWAGAYGTDVVAELEAAARAIAGDGTREGSPLFAGLEPPPGTWRADVPAPALLPHHPCVTHRGGFPDGS